MNLKNLAFFFTSVFCIATFVWNSHEATTLKVGPEDEGMILLLNDFENKFNDVTLWYRVPKGKQFDECVRQPIEKAKTSDQGEKFTLGTLVLLRNVNGAWIESRSYTISPSGLYDEDGTFWSVDLQPLRRLLADRNKTMQKEKSRDPK